MKTLKEFMAWLTLPVLFTACATLGIGQADQATRILADVACVTAVVGAGLQIAGDPVVNGAKTVLDVIAAINSVGASNVPASVLSVCKDTIAYASQDLSGAVALIKSNPGTDQPKATPPKMGARPPVQPKAPQPVIIPLTNR